jgi:hypothetical protein
MKIFKSTFTKEELEAQEARLQAMFSQHGHLPRRDSNGYVPRPDYGCRLCLVQVELRYGDHRCLGLES